MNSLLSKPCVALYVLLILHCVRLSAQEFTPESEAAANNDWSRFRGPNGTGISHAKTIPSEWTEEDYDWVVELPGEGHGSPVVVGDRLFVMCGESENAKRTVMCVDVISGDVIWAREFDSKPYRLHHDNNYGSSTPAADEKGVVLTWATPDALLVTALDHEGNTVWERDLGPYQAINGAGSSPIIVDDLVIVMNVQVDPLMMKRAGVIPEDFPATDPHDSSLVAIDRDSGEIRWQVERETYLASYATPCVRNLSGGEKEVIFLDSAHGLTGVSLQSGEVNWQTERLLPTRTVASPVMAGDLIFGSHGRGITGELLIALRAGSSDREPKIEYQIRIAAPLVPTPIVKDELAFFWSDRGIVTCLEWETGEVVWRERVGGNYYASPVWIDGRLFCVDRGGEVVVVSASREFELVSKQPLGETSFATPAVARDRIFFRTETKLFSLGGARQNTSPSGN